MCLGRSGRTTNPRSVPGEAGRSLRLVFEHLAREDAGGVQHFLLGEVAERKLADEVVYARLVRHPPHLLADRAGRSRDGAAILHQRFEILGQSDIARLGAVLLPELHEARVEVRPGATAKLHRLPVGIGRDHEAVDAHQGQVDPANFPPRPIPRDSGR